MKNIFFYLLIIPFFLLTSCVSKKKIVYFQGSQNFSNSSSNYEPIIQNDDILSIYVSAQDSEAALPFNLGTTVQGNTLNTTIQNYLVDNKGNIEFPVIGTTTVAGYSIEELKILLKEKLKKYIKDPVVNIRISNFKITILGEVSSPGVKISSGQRFTLLDAIGLAGDLTLYGQRENILIIRDFQGIKTFNRVDITKADFVNSPFYYLDQNDVIYVEPRKAKIDSTAIGGNVVTIISILSFLITTTLILIK